MPFSRTSFQRDKGPHCILIAAESAKRSSRIRLRNDRRTLRQSPIRCSEIRHSRYMASINRPRDSRQIPCTKTYPLRLDVQHHTHLEMPSVFSFSNPDTADTHHSVLLADEYEVSPSFLKEQA